MGTRGLLVCFTFSLALVIVCSFDTLRNMKDLKEKTSFGRVFPRHGLKILLWLICQGHIDQNGILQLNFNPAEKVYGSHYYGNYEKPLTFPDLSNLPYEYYTLGNIGIDSIRKQFPDFVTEDYCNSRGALRNLDRVVIRVQKNNPSRVDEVYIAQHFVDRNRGSGYDPENLYKISEELLREIQEYCPDDDHTHDKSHQKEDPNGDSDSTQVFNSRLLEFLNKAGYVTRAGNEKLKSCEKTPEPGFFRRNWPLLLFTLAVVIVIAQFFKRTSPAPPIVVVSEGRPGF